MTSPIDEPRPFSFTSPESVADAVALWHEHDGDAMYIAGGGDVIDIVKRHHARPSVVLDLKRIPGLRGVTANIAADQPSIRIGALTTLDEVAGNEDVRRYLPALATAASRVATPQIRNIGTVGGNLLQENRCPYFRGTWHCYRHGGMHCYAHHGINREHAIFNGDRCYVVSPSDLAPVVVAGNALIHVEGRDGARTIDAEKLFMPASQDLTRMHVLDKGEVLTAVEFRVREPAPLRERDPHDLGIRGTISPIPVDKRFPSVFLKYAMRNSFDFALASVAIFLDREGRRVHRCRIALGGVAATPYRPLGAERLVAGNRLSDEVILAAGRAAVHGAEPLDLNAYKVALVEKLVVEALQELSV